MRSIRALVLVCLATLACKREPVRGDLPEPQMQTVVAPEVEGSKPPTCDGTNTAIVGGEAIPIEDFDVIYSLKQRQYEETYREAVPGAMDAEFQLSISERLIKQKWLELECRRVGVEYDAAMLAEREAEQRYHLGDTPDALRRVGESEDTMRQLLIADLRERALLEHEGKLEISAEQVAAEYEHLRKRDFEAIDDRIRVAEIVIDVDDPAKEAEVLALAEELAKRANAGEDFAQLAREYSDGASAKEGGELGIIPARFMDLEVAEVAFQLEPGNISKPVRSTVRTSVSYHVVFVSERYPTGDFPLAVIEDEIVERLKKSKQRYESDELALRLWATHETRNCITESHLRPGSR